MELWQKLKSEGRTDPVSVRAQFSSYMPPTPVDYIIRHLDIGLYRSDLLVDLAGRLTIVDGHAEITLNRNDHLMRQRFTASHLLGHLMLHDGKSYVETDFRGGHEELEATAWAAGFLLPASAIDMALTSTGGSIQRMSVLFDVSEEAMVYRLKDLGFLPK